jgi:hypothetical protein
VAPLERVPSEKDACAVLASFAAARSSGTSRPWYPSVVGVVDLTEA